MLARYITLCWERTTRTLWCSSTVRFLFFDSCLFVLYVHTPCALIFAFSSSFHFRLISIFTLRCRSSCVVLLSPLGFSCRSLVCTSPSVGIWTLSLHSPFHFSFLSAFLSFVSLLLYYLIRDFVVVSCVHAVSALLRFRCILRLSINSPSLLAFYVSLLRHSCPCVRYVYIMRLHCCVFDEFVFSIIFPYFLLFVPASCCVFSSSSRFLSLLSPVYILRLHSWLFLALVFPFQISISFLCHRSCLLVFSLLFISRLFSFYPLYTGIHCIRPRKYAFCFMPLS